MTLCGGGVRSRSQPSNLKQLPNSAKVLFHFDHDKKCILSCDASLYGFWTVLLHEMENGQRKPLVLLQKLWLQWRRVICCWTRRVSQLCLQLSVFTNASTVVSLQLIQTIHHCWLFSVTLFSEETGKEESETWSPYTGDTADTWW